MEKKISYIKLDKDNVEKYGDDMAELMNSLSGSGKIRVKADLNLQEVLNDNTHTILAVDEDTDNAVGMATILFFTILAKNRAEVDDVVVFESHRGNRIGVTLMEKLHEIAQERANTRQELVDIVLTSRSSRKEAHGLYNKLGYTQLAESVGEKGTNLFQKKIEPEN